jgi:hypothetical protein
MSKLSEMLATLRQPTRPCASKDCPYAARFSRLACGSHDLGDSSGAYPALVQPRLPDEDQADIDRAEHLHRLSQEPRTSSPRVERMVRAAMATTTKDGDPE